MVHGTEWRRKKEMKGLWSESHRGKIVDAVWIAIQWEVDEEWMAVSERET